MGGVRVQRPTAKLRVINVFILANTIKTRWVRAFQPVPGSPRQRANPLRHLISPRYLEGCNSQVLGKPLGEALEALIRELERFLDEARHAAPVAVDHDPFIVPPTVPNIILLEGPPGSGKTSAIVNFIECQKRRLINYLATGLAIAPPEKPRVIPLPIIYPNLMPPGDHPLAWVLLGFQNLIDMILSLSQWGFHSERRELLEKAKAEVSTSLATAATLAIANYTNILTYTTSSIEEYAEAALEVGMSGANLALLYRKFASQLRSALGLEDAIILVSLDDLDTRLDLLYDITLACRLLSADPQTVCLIGLRSDLGFEDLTRYMLHGLIRRHYGEVPAETSNISPDPSKLISQNLLFKNIYATTRIAIKELTLEEALKFTPYQEIPDYQPLGSLLDSAKLEAKDAVWSISWSLGSAFHLKPPSSPENGLDEELNILLAPYSILIPRTARGLIYLTEKLSEAIKTPSGKNPAESVLEILDGLCMHSTVVLPEIQTLWNRLRKMLAFHTLPSDGGEPQPILDISYHYYTYSPGVASFTFNITPPSLMNPPSPDTGTPHQRICSHLTGSLRDYKELITAILEGLKSKEPGGSPLPSDIIEVLLEYAQAWQSPASTPTAIAYSSFWSINDSNVREPVKIGFPTAYSWDYLEYMERLFFASTLTALSLSPQELRLAQHKTPLRKRASLTHEKAWLTLTLGVLTPAAFTTSLVCPLLVIASHLDLRVSDTRASDARQSTGARGTLGQAYESCLRLLKRRAREHPLSQDDLSRIINIEEFSQYCDRGSGGKKRGPEDTRNRLKNYIINYLRKSGIWEIFEVVSNVPGLNSEDSPLIRALNLYGDGLIKAGDHFKNEKVKEIRTIVCASHYLFEVLRDVIVHSAGEDGPGNPGG